MDKAEESVLVAGLVRMDATAWESLCSTYSLPLVAFIRCRFGCSRDMAEEVVQMAFVRCVKSIRSFSPERGRLYAWLKVISKNEGCTLLSDPYAGREAPGESVAWCEVTDEILERIDDAVLPDETIARQEVQLLIHEVLMMLPDRQREALAMKYLENCRVSEIAQRLGQSEKVVESLLSRARSAFRELFTRKLRASRTAESEYVDEI
jgi:RNA polymerase sigma-70 factor, ECF subfamily